MIFSLYINNRIASNKVHFNISVYDLNSFCYAVASLELVSYIYKLFSPAMILLLFCLPCTFEIKLNM